MQVLFSQQADSLFLFYFNILSYPLDAVQLEYEGRNSTKTNIGVNLVGRRNYFLLSQGHRVCFVI